RDLPPVGVALDLEVDEAEVLSVEDDHARTRAEDRRLKGADRGLEPVQADEAHDCGRLPTWDDQPVEALELLWEPHLDAVCAEPPQDGRVLAKRALNREHANTRVRLHGGNSRDGRSADRVRS